MKLTNKQPIIKGNDQRKSGIRGLEKKDNFSRITSVIALIIALLTPTIIANYFKNQNNKFTIEIQNSLLETQSKVSYDLIQTQSSFQESMIATQAEIDRDYSFAMLQINKIKIHTWDFTGGFEVKNIGRAVAENLWITIHIDDTSEIWHNAITDISDFNILYSPSTNNPEIKTSRTEGFYDLSDIENNNEYQILIQQLPPENSFTINIERPNVSTKKINFQRKLIIESDYSPIYIDNYFFREPMEEYYYTAKFSVDAGCDTCKNFGHLYGVTVSFLGPFEIIGNELENTFINGSYKSIYDTSIGLLIPEDVNLSPNISDLFFTVSEYDKEFNPKGTIQP